MERFCLRIPRISSRTASFLGWVWGPCLSSRKRLRIPMMSISHSDLMPIRTERSDAGLSQCEIVIDIRQEFCLFFLVWFYRKSSFGRCSCFWPLTEGARRATGVSGQKQPPTRHYSPYFALPHFSFRRESPRHKTPTSPR